MGQVDEHARVLYGVPKLEDGTGDGFAEWCRSAGADLARCIEATVTCCGEVGLWLESPNQQSVPGAIMSDPACMQALHAEYRAAYALGECLASSGDQHASAVQDGVRKVYWALTVADQAGAVPP